MHYLLLFLSIFGEIISSISILCHCNSHKLFLLIISFFFLLVFIYLCRQFILFTIFLFFICGYSSFCNIQYNTIISNERLQRLDKSLLTHSRYSADAMKITVCSSMCGQCDLRIYIHIDLFEYLTFTNIRNDY